MPVTATAGAATTAHRRASRRRGRADLHVLSPALFREALIRERNRAVRLDQPCALRLIALDDAVATGSAAGLEHRAAGMWPNVIEALSRAVGDTAYLGWLEPQVALGAIVPVSPGPDQEALIRRELSREVGAEKASRFTVVSDVSLPTAATHTGEILSTEYAFAGFSPERQQSGMRDRVKRAVDVAGSATLLLMLSPVFALIAVLIKLTSPGPVLFRQARIGQGGKPFTMLKFRTMRVDADPSLHHEFVTSFIKSSAQLHPAGRKAVFKLTNDPRVTPLGRVLRKTSLDELPQLWNTLRGEMSLVGPRPPLAYEVEHYRPWHWRRVLDAKPGITGLWQVTGRSQTTFDEMVRLDLQYAKNRSLWMDIKILLATPRAVISGKGAR